MPKNQWQTTYVPINEVESSLDDRLNQCEDDGWEVKTVLLVPSGPIRGACYAIICSKMTSTP